MKMAVTADEYQEAMNPEGNFKLTATIRLAETKQMFAQTEAFFLRKPGLSFDVSCLYCTMFSWNYILFLCWHVIGYNIIVLCSVVYESYVKLSDN